MNPTGSSGATPSPDSARARRASAIDPASGPSGGPDAIAALAHPLRRRLLALLRREGTATATRLADQVGESTGLVSYHMRQLARAGLTVDAEPPEVAGRAARDGRERWWRAAPADSAAPDPRGDRQVSSDEPEEAVLLLAEDADNTRRWLGVAAGWPSRWKAASVFADYAVRLTPDRLEAFRSEFDDLVTRYRDACGEREPARAPGPSGATAPEGLAASPEPGDGDAVEVVLQLQAYPSGDQPAPAA